MSRIATLFNQKNNRVLNVYCTAGFPFLNSTINIMQMLQKQGADMVEIGMPYSDPLADGPIIQASSSRAIANGMTIDVLFDQLANMRTNGVEKITLPVVLMGYMNPVMQYGFEKFCAKAAKVGIDGLILPDLPMVDFDKTYNRVLQQYGLDFIFLITPETSNERIKLLDERSSGFLYAVSASGTTGSGHAMAPLAIYLKRLQTLQLKNPVLVGFGIKDNASFEAACQHANGAIVGSAFINALENDGEQEVLVSHFIKAIKGG